MESNITLKKKTRWLIPAAKRGLNIENVFDSSFIVIIIFDKKMLYKIAIEKNS